MFNELDKGALLFPSSKLPSPCLPDLLQSYGDAAAWVLPMQTSCGSSFGNNGDRLMEYCTAVLLANSRLRLVPNPKSADIILVPPSGALLERYQFPKLLAERLAPHPDTPVVILPCSAQFPTLSPGFIFEGRSAPTTWIFREPASRDQIRDNWGGELLQMGVDLLLDHDVTISVADAVASMFWRPAEARSGRLVCARTDTESALRGDARLGGRSALAGRLREVVAGSDWLLMRHLKARHSLALSKRLGQQLERSVQPLLSAGLPATYVDLSNSALSSYGEYVDRIACSAEVVTDRLHVGAPAALAGRAVFLVPNGYHKISSIYDHSLSGLPNVHLVKVA